MSEKTYDLTDTELLELFQLASKANQVDGVTVSLFFGKNDATVVTYSSWAGDIAFSTDQPGLIIADKVVTYDESLIQAKRHLKGILEKAGVAS